MLDTILKKGMIAPSVELIPYVPSKMVPVRIRGCVITVSRLTFMSEWVEGLTRFKGGAEKPPFPFR